MGAVVMTKFDQLNNLRRNFYRSVLTTNLVWGLMVAMIVPATAATLPTIHIFENTGDGEYPQAGLTLFDDTRLVGTTFGSVGSDAPGKNCGRTCGNQYSQIIGGQLKTNHFFQGGKGGAFPTGEVVVQSDGSIFGTTELGGGTACGGLGCGTAFVFPATGRPKVFKFCLNPYFPGCPNG